VSFDLLFQSETDSDWARGPRTKAEPLSFTPAEARALKLLESSTRTHVVEVIGWARSRGIPARLSTQAVIYTPEVSEQHYREGRSGIAPGKLDWHQVGRAYHLVIVDPKSRKLDRDAYARVGAYARSRGGEWLGDKIIRTPKGPVQDLAHFEYHPDFDIVAYRKLPLAQLEYRQAQARAAKYT